MARATAAATAVMVVDTVAMPVSTAAMIALHHAAMTTPRHRHHGLHVNLTMRRVQHLLIVVIAPIVAPHLHAHSHAKNAAVLKIAHRVSIPVAMTGASRVQTHAAMTVVLPLVVIVRALRIAVSAHRVLNLRRVQTQASPAVKTVAQPSVIARLVRSRIVSHAHSAEIATTVRSVIVHRARSAATAINAQHLARLLAAVQSTHHAHVSTANRVIVHRALNTHRVQSVRTSRRAQNSQHRAPSVTSVMTNAQRAAATVRQAQRSRHPQTAAIALHVARLSKPNTRLKWRRKAANSPKLITGLCAR